MESKYYYRYICSNGHNLDNMGQNQVPEHPYCYMCGAEVISKCQNCSAQINGYEIKGYFLGELPVPNYCYNCSEPFPWTKSLIDNSVELIALDKKLNKNDEEVLKNELPFLLVESNRTPLSQGKVKLIHDKMNPQFASLFQQLIKDFVSQSIFNGIFN